MKRNLPKQLLTLLFAVTTTIFPGGGNLKMALAQAQSTSPATGAPVGKGARIFVDKAHPAHGDLIEADFKQLADAGFTVVANRWGKGLDGREIDLNSYVSRAANTGLAVMKWDSGLVDATDDTDRAINRLGKATRYTSTLSEKAWQQLTEHLLEYARLSLKQPHFKGVLLDFEIYDRANKTDGFCESYDDRTLSDFITSTGRDVPSPLPPLDKRKTWLEQRQWYQMYIGYHTDMIAKKSRALRQAIDVINPRFQIGVYGWGVLVSPVIHELATPQAPLLLLDAMTYGRSLYSNAFDGGYDGNRPDQEGLQWSLEMTQKLAASAHNRYENIIFLAGHYPQSPGPKDGTQYKFTAKQAFQSAAFGEGYWIWTDWITPKPWKERREWYNAMIDYFGEAHKALDAKDWSWAQREPDTVK
jgi:hypothetical protein